MHRSACTRFLPVGSFFSFRCLLLLFVIIVIIVIIFFFFFFFPVLSSFSFTLYTPEKTLPNLGYMSEIRLGKKI
jgi:hypothetical protein